MAEKRLILIVDDQEVNRSILADQIEALGHLSLSAENGLSALASIERQPPDLILLDIMMPQMDGRQVLERLKADHARRHIPVIMITAIDELDSVVGCIELGADDYLVKPFKPALLRARIKSCLEKKELRDREEQYRRQIQDYNLNLEQRVQEQVKQISSAQLETIFAMSKLAESRDPETGEHLERMREYCKVLAQQLRRLPQHSATIDEAYVENLHTASPLHDIGKIGIPDGILQKPGRLTAEEFEIMKTHAAIGEDSLNEVDRLYPGNAFVHLGAEIAGSHHEKWDGSGYPRGLAGEAIPLAGRILALGDVYDALTSRRCYKKPFPHETSKEIILEQREKHFDPDVVDAFLAAEDQFVKIKEQYADKVEGQNTAE